MSMHASSEPQTNQTCLILDKDNFETDAFKEVLAPSQTNIDKAKGGHNLVLNG